MELTPEQRAMRDRVDESYKQDPARSVMSLREYNSEGLRKRVLIQLALSNGKPVQSIS